MRVINVIVVGGKEILIKDFPDKEQLSHNLNKEALEQFNYYEEEENKCKRYSTCCQPAH